MLIWHQPYQFEHSRCQSHLSNHQCVSDGHSSKSQPGSYLLNFSDQTMSGRTLPMRFHTFTSRGCFFEMIILSTNNPSQTGAIFSRWSLWVPIVLCYLHNWTFHPIVFFISILFALCLHKPYFLLFKSNLVAFNDNSIWSLLFYVDLETSSNIKLICVPTHKKDICSSGTNYTFFAIPTI